MAGSGQELEVKFYIEDLAAIERRLAETGGNLVQARVYEANLRFDTPDGALTRSLQVLRLRQDTAARVTFKGPGQVQGGVKVRKELEFTVSDFDTAHQVFEALGYQVAVMYEKYRAVYAWGAVLVALDEMPYGTFIEIEGPDGATIQNAAKQLGLDWETRILDSYLVMFDRLKAQLGLNFKHLSFENFSQLPISAGQLGVRPGI